MITYHKARPLNVNFYGHNSWKRSLKISKFTKVYVEIFLGQHSFLEAPSYRIPKNGKKNCEKIFMFV